jgi:hypothetical protein
LVLGLPGLEKRTLGSGKAAQITAPSSLLSVSPPDFNLVQEDSRIKGLNFRLGIVIPGTWKVGIRKTEVQAWAEKLRLLS